MPNSGERHALVIGGSMSGLFAASLLARAGWTAAIYERAEAELSGRGAGIVTHAAMHAVLRAAPLTALTPHTITDPERLAAAVRLALSAAARIVLANRFPER